MKKGSCSIEIKLVAPEQQMILKEVIDELKHKFPDVDMKEEVLSKALIPFEITLALTLGVASNILYDCIKYLWKLSHDRKIAFKIRSGFQDIAESYLESQKISKRNLKLRRDLSDKSYFVYENYEKHYITIYHDGRLCYRRE